MKKLIEILRGLQMGARAEARSGATMGRRLSTRYDVVAHDRYGNELWRESVHNLVVDAGLNDSLDKHLKGSSYTAAWYIGLADGTPTFAAADTMSSHAGWAEVEAYDEATRQALTLGSVSAKSVDNSASKAVFTCSTNATVIGGAFMTSVSTKGGSTGVLYGGAAFSADRTLNDGDTLTITVTCTAAAS